MLVNALMSLVLAVLRVLLLPLKLIAIPQTSLTTIDMALAYIYDGFQVVAFYTHWYYLTGLVAFCLAVNATVWGYKGIMWILRKIPFLGILD